MLLSIGGCLSHHVEAASRNSVVSPEAVKPVQIRRPRSFWATALPALTHSDKQTHGWSSLPAHLVPYQATSLGMTRGALRALSQRERGQETMVKKVI